MNVRLLGVLAVLLAVPALADPQPAQPDAAAPANDAAPVPAAPAATPAAAPPAPVPTATKEGLIGLLGKDVKANGSPDSIGKITDVLVDKSGAVSAVVIDVGGFLGVGSRKIAVDWQLLHIDPTDAAAPISVAADRAALQAAPVYAASKEQKEVVQPTDATPAAADSADKPAAESKPPEPASPDGPR